MEYAALRLQLNSPEQGRSRPIWPRGRAAGAWYMPHLRVTTDGEYLGVAFLDGPEILRPGEEGECEVVLLYDGVDYSLLQPGALFELLEGAKVIGGGEVLRRWSTDATWGDLASA